MAAAEAAEVARVAQAELEEVQALRLHHAAGGRAGGGAGADVDADADTDAVTGAGGASSVSSDSGSFRFHRIVRSFAVSTQYSLTRDTCFVCFVLGPSPVFQAFLPLSTPGFLPPPLPPFSH